MVMIIRNLNFSYGEKNIFKDFDLQIPRGAVACVMGESGCGKTTLLNCISRQLQYGGTIDYQSDKDAVAYVFQQPRLIPSMSVEDNIKFVIPSGVSKEELKRRVDGVISKLEIDGCRKSYPSKISGGQASRVSLARALVVDSDVLLMDEPFKGLDVKLKSGVIKSIIEILQNKTTVFVAHDPEEALALADRIYILERKEGDCVAIKGQIEIGQNQSQRDLYSASLNEARREIYYLLSQ